MLADCQGLEDLLPGCHWTSLRNQKSQRGKSKQKKKKDNAADWQAEEEAATPFGSVWSWITR
jgi:hypothetical protein